MNTQKSYNGYYSEMMYKISGYAIYSSPNGEDVVVTEIVEDDRLPFSQWNDLKPVGTVCEYVASFDARGVQE